jgi:putative transposase
MSRRSRCVCPGVPHHVTQRGVDRSAVFTSDFDRENYLRLLREQLTETPVRMLGWCLMTNHVHLILVPEESDSLALLLRRVHGRYAQYFNVRAGRVGHLWQNRYFSCALGPRHVARALAYVDNNPVRARMVDLATDYPWSSATAHLYGVDLTGMLDCAWRSVSEVSADWTGYLVDAQRDGELEKCTYAGRPFGDADFLNRLGEMFGRHWKRGRPKKEMSNPSSAAQFCPEPFSG